MKRAKTWITTCLSDHQDCRDFHDRTVALHRHQRPTRVLDVTDSNTIRLRCDMADEHFDYLVLSHMWGKPPSQQLLLLTSNLTAFKREVPRAELEASTTFKEAVRLTRALGYRYLWIDSLCIIQDSPVDWEFEARRMAIVYGNAVCNLSFLLPPGGAGQEELGVRSDPRAWNPCILRPASSECSGLYIEHPKGLWYSEYYDDGKEFSWQSQRNWPLFGRAWYVCSDRSILPNFPPSNIRNIDLTQGIELTDRLTDLTDCYSGPSKNTSSPPAPSSSATKTSCGTARTSSTTNSSAA